MEYLEFKIKVPKPTRKWFQFTIRTLLVLMFGVGVGAVLTRISQEPDSTFRQPVKWGTLGMNVTPVSRKQLPPSSRYRGGLRIVKVRRGGPAARAGIREGDIMVGLNKSETVGPDDLNFAIREIDGEDLSSVKFLVLRGEESLFGHIDWK